MHSHSIVDECTPACPAHDPNAWRCSRCRRQVPMLADTEDWDKPICADCYENLRTLLNARVTVLASSAFP